MSNYCLPVILVLSLIASLVVSSSDDFDFMEISEDVPQDVSAVFLPTSCTASGKTPNTMFTFEPVDNDKITILTYPKDLVTFDVDRSEDGSSMILMQWNDDVAKDAKRGGGVRILFPPHQLKQVDVADKLKAQILDGFTEIESLSVSNKATLQATFTNLTVPIRIVSAKSLSAHLTVISNAGFENVQVSAFANLELQGNVHDQVSVSSYGGLTRCWEMSILVPSPILACCISTEIFSERSRRVRRTRNFPPNEFRDQSRHPNRQLCIPLWQGIMTIMWRPVREPNAKSLTTWTR
jgi:hypothetical protein